MYLFLIFRLMHGLFFSNPHSDIFFASCFLLQPRRRPTPLNAMSPEVLSELATILFFALALFDFH